MYRVYAAFFTVPVQVPSWNPVTCTEVTFMIMVTPFSDIVSLSTGQNWFFTHHQLVSFPGGAARNKTT